MSATSRRLCLVYGVTAVLALFATWHQNLHYVREANGFVDTNLRFWQATLVNPASISITVDLFLFGLAVTIWQVLEARRLQLRFVWLYVLFGLLIAISFTFPLFLIARELRLAQIANQTATQAGAEPPGRLSLLDGVLLVSMGLGIAGFAFWTLGR
jgi:Terpene cyclase DEP1